MAYNIGLSNIMAGFMVGHVACRNVIDDTFKEYLGQYKGPFKNIYFLQKEAWLDC